MTNSKLGSDLRRSRMRKAGLVISDVQRLPLQRGEVIDGALGLATIALRDVRRTERLGGALGERISRLQFWN